MSNKQIHEALAKSNTLLSAIAEGKKVKASQLAFQIERNEQAMGVKKADPEDKVMAREMAS